MKSSRKTLATLGALLVAAVGTLSAHDMFLKLSSFFLEPHSGVTVALMNGTFAESENVITRDRVIDVSIVGPAGVTHPPASAWRDSAVHHANPDSADTAILSFDTGEPGTYVIGVSTRARVFDLSAEDFNAYLEHDGVLDILELRKRRGELEKPATERYSKHVKAIAQVGEARTDTYAHALGYPIEFLPLRNPYELGVGDTLRVRLLRAGEPLPNQLVYASHEGYHAHDPSGGHREAVRTRTDGEGVARIPLDHPGKWYMRTIHMAERADEAEVDYESNWATITFELR